MPTKQKYLLLAAIIFMTLVVAVLIVYSLTLDTNYDGVFVSGIRPAGIK